MATLRSSAQRLTIPSYAFFLSLGACGGAALPSVEAPRATGPVGRSVVALSDLETVHDVTQSGEALYAATSHGLYRWEGEGVERLTDVETYAVASSVQGIVALTASGLVDAQGEVLVGVGALPVRPRHLHIAAGAAFVGGAGGLGRGLWNGQWRFEVFADAAAVTGFFEGAGEDFWVGTTRGLLRIEGEQVEEHAPGRGIPASVVRGVANVGPGRALALVQDEAGAGYLAYFDGSRWFAYTLAEFDVPVVDLARDRTGPVLLTRHSAIRLGDGGVRLSAIGEGEAGQVLRYLGTGTSMSRTAEEVDLSRAVQLIAVPAQNPTFDAPEWGATPTSQTARRFLGAWNVGADLLLADAHRGLRTLEGEHSYRTGTLVAEEDLRLVSSQGRAWILTDNGSLGVWTGDGFRALSSSGFAIQAIASSVQGVFAAALDESGFVVLLQWNERWQTLDRRRLLQQPAPEEDPAANDVALPMARVSAISHLAVRDDGEVWLGIVVDEGQGPAPRGVAVYRPGANEVTYHHRAANPEQDGAGALQMPNRFENIDLGEEGMAWFSTLVGAVRLGNSQAVVFGEARGVRGEVVSDVLVGSAAKIWVAAAEGPGYYHRQRFEFRFPQRVIDTRPRALALAEDGSVWTAGIGLARYAGESWTVFGDETIEGALVDGDGIEETVFSDVEADGSGRIWVLGEEAVYLIEE